MARISVWDMKSMAVIRLASLGAPRCGVRRSSIPLPAPAPHPKRSAALGAEVQVRDAQAGCDGAVLEGARGPHLATAEGERSADRAGVGHDRGWERASGDGRERGARSGQLLAQRLAAR